MDKIADLLFNGKILTVMPEKQFRKLKIQSEELLLRLEDPWQFVEIVCHITYPNKRLYILPEEYEKIPQGIRNKLRIKDIRPYSVPEHVESPEEKKTASKNRDPQFSSIYFSNLSYFSDYKTDIATPTALQVLKKKIKIRRAILEIGDVQAKLNCYFASDINRILVPNSEFDQLPLSVKLRFRLRPEGEGCLTVVGIFPASSMDSQQKSNKSKRRKTPQKNTAEDIVSPCNMEKQPHKEAPHFNGKVVVSDDNILPLCKKKKIRFGEHICYVTGYISEASGSLLVPARHFTTEVPPDIRGNLKWEDPVGYLRKYEKPSEANIGEWASLKAQSLLHRYGYSVKAGIAKETRQKILFTVVEKNDLSKDEIIRHIRSLIARNKNRYPEACSRWKEDMAYVQGLTK